MEEALQNGLSTVAEFVPKLVAFLLILIIGWSSQSSLARRSTRSSSGSASTVPSNAAG